MRVIIRLVILGVSVYLFLIEYLLYRRWRRRLRSEARFRKAALIYWSFITFTHLPFLYMVIFGRDAYTFAIEGWLKIPAYLYLSWQYPLFFYSLFYIAAVTLLWLLEYFTRFSPVHNRFMKRKQRAEKNHPPAEGKSAAEQKAAVSEESGHPDRRGFLRMLPGLALATDSVPFVLSSVSFTGMLTGSTDFALMQREFFIKNLHRDLDGLSGIHISDLHIGNLINDDWLGRAAEVILAQKAGFLVVTGDIIDNNNYFLPVAGRFFRKLEPHFKHGMYGIPGNHDHIDDPLEAARAFNKAGLNMLINRSVILKRGRGELNLAGLDYPRPARRNLSRRMQISEKYYRQTELQFKKERPVILMNHHPTDFIYQQHKNIDLVLSGHTHGGQFVFSSDRESPLAITKIWYPYFIDHYTENNTQLYVNRGLGHWFPLRINCPPEITVFTLRSA